MSQYYNRYDPKKNYKELKFFAAKYIQSAELNELQAYQREDFKNLAGSVFKDGSILDGGSINLVGNIATVEESLIYANGYTIVVPSRDIEISLIGEVAIGVAVSSKEISFLEDAELLDPAVGTAGYKEDGASRLQVNGRWCLESELVESETFYLAFRYKDGVLQSTKRIAPELEGARKIVARYDYDSNGSYVVNGLNTSFDYDDIENELHILSVEAGNAHVDGDELIFEYAQKVALPFATDTKSVIAEPYTFSGDGIYELRHTPIKEVTRVVGIKEITEDVTHGSYAGASDILPHTPVVEVISIKQDDTTYIAGTDFSVDGDFIKWIGDNEPAPGSTYSVNYKYQTHLEDLEHTDTTINLSGLAEGSSFYVNYDYYLTRRDRLILTRDGNFEILRGVADEFNAVAPKATVGLSLAEIEVKRNQEPYIILNYDKTVKMSELHTLFRYVGDLAYNIAKIELRNNAAEIDPTLNLRATFVDPFFDDNIRDLGIEQNAVIANNSLLPEIKFEQHLFNFDNNIALPYTLDGVLIEQRARSNKRLINEFMEAPLPPKKITLKPATYRWVAGTTYYKKTYYIHTATRFIGSKDLGIVDTNKRVVVPQTLLSIKAETFTKEIVDIYIDGKKAAEVQTIKIDENRYKVDTTVTTPEGIISGRNLVKLVGRDSGIVVEDVWVTIAQDKKVLLMWVDPLAQTILFDRDTFMQELQLYIEEMPITYLKLIVCKTTVGEPDTKQTIFSQTYELNDINLGWQTFKFNEPVLLEAHQEYAILVECGDAVGKVATAKLGDFDIENKKWIQKQPYAGVLLSSANGSTWTAYQREDLSLVVPKPKYEESLIRELGRVNVESATDLFLMANSKVYVGTSVKYRAILVDRDNSIINLNEFALSSFSAYSGEIILEAELTTTNRDFTPIIDKDIVLAVGKVESVSTYISREFEVTGTRADVYLDIAEVGDSVKVFAQIDSNFIELPKDTTRNRLIGNGFVETCFKLENLDISKTRLKIELSATDINRPIVQNLRGVIS